MIDKGQCPFHREMEGCEIEREEGSKRARTSEEHSDFQRVDKEAPSMQIKCCFHNHSSVPLSEVRFFVIKVKRTCTRGRVRSFAPTNQPANQPSRRTNHHPLTHPTTTRPQTLLISITKSFALLCDANKKISFFLSSTLMLSSFFLFSFLFASTVTETNISDSSAKLIDYYCAIYRNSVLLFIYIYDLLH